MTETTPWRWAGRLLLVGIVVFFAVRWVLDVQADRQAPDLRNDVYDAVDRAVDDGELSVAAYDDSMQRWVLDQSQPVPDDLFPAVDGATFDQAQRRGDELHFRYRGDDRAPGHCVRGRIEPDGRVTTEAIGC